MNPDDLPRHPLTSWLAGSSLVTGAVLFGSRARSGADPSTAATAKSDWDFQLVVRSPDAFKTQAWTSEIASAPLSIYAVKRPLVGKGLKVIFRAQETSTELSVVGASYVRWLRFAVTFGLHRRNGSVRRVLQDLASILRPEWNVLKGGAGLAAFYRRITRELPEPRLTDRQIENLVATFVCDCHGVISRLERGELTSAQRLLHLELCEINFRLLHEFRLRCGQRSFERARHLETTLAARELCRARVNAGCEPIALRRAVDEAAAYCRELAGGLLAGSASPHVPNLLDAVADLGARSAKSK